MNKLPFYVAASTLSLALAGCGGGGGGGSTPPPSPGDPKPGVNQVTVDENTGIKSITINATSHSDYTYLNLETGKVLDLNAAQAAASTNWHMGFRRYGIILNGGASGPGTVQGALAAAQEDFYSDGEPNVEVFLAATAEQEEEHLLASYDLSSLTFVADAPTAAIKGSKEWTFSGADQILDEGWYFYNLNGHSITLNDENWWLVRSNTGESYAKFHATELSYSPATGLDVTFEFNVQPANTTQFTSTATFDALVATDGAACFDFDADATVECTSSAWDIKLEVKSRQFNIWVNGGISGSGQGAAFGPLPTADADQYNNATMSPDGSTPIVQHYEADKNAGIFEDKLWHAYHLSNAHKLWPNYRVYIIDSDPEDADAKKFAVQITNYYYNLVSGHPTVRIFELPGNQ